MHAEPLPGPFRIIDGRYELRALLGRGAHADVFDVVHVLTRREHALKLWRLALERPEDAARWNREILAPTQISHPSMVPITDAGVDSMQRPFVVMDRLGGEDLSKRLERGPLSIDESLDVFELLIEGLAAAHEAGIVHRDLKPANVFLERGERGELRVRILDFGYALQLVQGMTRITGEGVSLGTVYYMAPEQAVGAEDITRAVDVWAVGAILYECIAGRRPFDSDDVSVLMTAICHGDFVPPVELAPQVPRIIGAIIERCLRVASHERYGDAGVLRAAWSAVRATRASWESAVALDPDEAPTRALGSGAGSRSQDTRPAPWWPTAPVMTEPSVIPATRARQPGNGKQGNVANPRSAPEPSEPASTVRRRPVEPQPLARMPTSPPPIESELRSRDEAPGGLAGAGWRRLVVAAIVLAASASILFVTRDSVLVPLLSGGPDALGEVLFDRFWTPVVSIAAALLFVSAAIAGAGAALRARRGRPPR